MYKIIFEKNARFDIQSGIDYYDSKQKGLGRKFANAVKKTSDTLKINPFKQIIYKEYRGVLVKQFPFLPIDFLH